MKTKRSDFIPNILGLDRRNWAGYYSSQRNNGSLRHKAVRSDQAVPHSSDEQHVSAVM